MWAGELVFSRVWEWARVLRSVAQSSAGGKTLVLCSRGQCWVQHCSTLLMSGWWNRALPQQVHRWHRTGRSGWYTRGLCHHSEILLHWEIGKEESHEFSQVKKSYKLERNNVGTSTCWRLSVLKEVFWSFAEEDFGVLVNNKLSRYLQCALGPMAPWTPLGRALPGGQGRDYSCLLSTGKARTGCAQR